MQILASLDANLQPYELTGADAPLYWQRGEDESYLRADHVVRVADALTWDATALALNAVQLVTVADPPAGQVLQSYALAVDGAKVIAATPTFAAAPPPAVPEIVSRMQLRRQLLTMDRTDGQTSVGKLRDQVDAGIANSGDLDLIEYWANTSDFHRHHEKVEQMLTVFSITDAQADAAWIAAALLT